MAADQGNVVVDGCLGGGAADRISNLPDHLLHLILIRLPSAAYAASTSVLSRRWRRVWTQLPELTLRYDISPASADAALAAWSAPVLRRLEIALAWFYWRDVTPGHVSSWLRFASRRLAGELRFSLRLHVEEVELPVSGGFTAVSLAFVDHTPRLRFQRRLAGGEFTALAALKIKSARMEVRELEEVVSSRCPRLKELALEEIVLLSRDHRYVLSIRSDSLEKLRVVASNGILFDGGPLQELFGDSPLQIATPPELQELSMCFWGEGIGAHIAALKLSEVYWSKSCDPSHHRLMDDAGRRHLKLLELTTSPSCLELLALGRFDAVDELHLHIFLPVSGGAEEYMTILEDTSEIRCAVLVVTFLAMSHAFEPIMLHLLRKCVGIRKLVVGFLTRFVMPRPCELSSCPCNLAHNHLTNGILLDSLQEVVVERAGNDEEQIVRLVSLLCRCSETFQKKVHVTISLGISSRLKSMCMNMRRDIDILLSAANNKVEVTIC